jgi:hypothetical protein
MWGADARNVANIIKAAEGQKAYFFDINSWL